jgi:hypothetical protein
MLVRKGIVLPTLAILSAALFEESAHAAPANFSVPFIRSSPEGLSIAKGAMNIMNWAKIKLVAAITAAVLVASGAGIIVLNRSMAASTDAPIPVQSQAAIPPARDKNLVGFTSPFLELVGCRIKQPVNFALTRKPPSEQQVSWTEQQFPLIRWSIDPDLAKQVSGYTVSIASIDDPASAKSIAVAKDATELAQGPNEPGDYIVKVSANSAGANAIAESTAHITIKALPITQIMINDLQPDGAIEFTSVMQYLNTDFNEIREGNFMNSNFVNVEKMTDDQGDPLSFTVAQTGNIFRYHYALNTPVQPGQAAMMSSAGTMTGLVKQWSPGVFIYSMNHSPATSAPVRRIELYRLPRGARLLAVSPTDLPNKTIDGQIQIFVDVMIPTGGSNAVAVRWRMPEQH